MVNWEDDLCEFTHFGDWQKTLTFGDCVPLAERNKYLWVWPTIDNLRFIKNILQKHNLCGILSIGCGSGLLEWIIQESCETTVQGIELDSSWWKSRYSPKTFIQLNFTEQEISSTFLMKCSKSKNWDFGLLFCYFNNRSAFLKYLECYKGNCLIIIGPGECSGNHTDPKPLEPNFEDNLTWNLSYVSEIGTSQDVIAVYLRKQVPKM